jgi:hypothetical protein
MDIETINEKFILQKPRFGKVTSEGRFNPTFLAGKLCTLREQENPAKAPSA